MSLGDSTCAGILGTHLVLQKGREAATELQLLLRVKCFRILIEGNVHLQDDIVFSTGGEWGKGRRRHR